MNPIAGHASPPPVAYGASAGGGSLQAEQTRAGFYAEEQRADLTITTAEGDTVTLSLATAREATAGAYQRHFQGDGESAFSQGLLLDFSSNRSAAVRIVGDLSETELADIREAVKTIGNMIDDFLAGDVAEMAEEGRLLRELGSIAGLDAAFTAERRVAYAQQETVAIRSGSTEGHGHNRGHGRLHRFINRIDRLTDDMVDQVKDFGGRQKHLARTVQDLLGRYRSGEADNAPADDLGREAIRAVHTAFIQKIQTVTASAGFNLSYAA